MINGTTIRRRQRRTLLLLAAVIPLAVVIEARIVVWYFSAAPDTAQANPHNTFAGLRALPEDTLHYPGSVVLGRYGGDPYRNWGGGLDAISGAYLGVNAPHDQVLKFYDAEVSARGWRSGRPTGVLSTEVTASFWYRDDLLLKIGVLRNSAPDARLPQGALDYTTVYTLEVSYGGFPSPSPTATSR